MVKEDIHVKLVVSFLPNQIISKDMREFTQERNHIIANTVIKDSITLKVIDNTKDFTQGKNHMNAIHVVRHSLK